MSSNRYIVDYEPVRPGKPTSATSDVEVEQDEFARRSIHSERLVEEEPGWDAGASLRGTQPTNNSPAESNVTQRVATAGSGRVLGRAHSVTYALLFLFTGILYFRPYEYLPLPTWLAFVFAALTLAAYVPSQLIAEGNLTARPREVNLVLLLTLFAALSIPLALNPSEAVQAFNEPFLKAVLIFIVMVNVVRSERRLKGLMWLSVAVSCVLSIGALNDFRLGKFTVEGYRVAGNLGGMFSNPNEMALHLVTGVPLALALALSTRGLLKKLLYGVAAMLMVGGIMVSFSRGAFLGLLGAIAVLTWKVGRRHHLAVVVVLVVAVAAFIALAPGGYGLRMFSIFDSSLDSNASSSIRQAVFWRSINTAIRNPLLGVGIGNFHIVSIRELVSHNAYTQVAAEMGAAACVVYTLFIVTPLRRLRQIERETFARRHNDESRFHYLSIGLQASLVAYMISSFFASVAYQWYIYYLVAYAVAWRRVYEAQAAPTGNGDAAVA